MNERENNNKYLQKASSLGHLFRPIAVEVFGRWGETAEETLKEVSMLAPPVLGVSCQKFRRDLLVFPLLDILVLTVMTEQFHRSRGTLLWTLFCIL